METEALDFAGALELLADRYGVELQRESEDPEAERRRRRRERLLALLERASKFYAAYLWKADEAAASREYLLGRGLREETLREFGVGYAPGGWDRLTSAARRDGFSDDELLATGLSQRRREGSGLIDRFRGRITFPLTNARGRVTGFGARATSAEQRPKYLNTSEGEVFHKGSQLFGLDIARSPASRAGRLVAVEGYTDVLALHQAGIPETVAIMGTALTGEQLKALRLTAPEIIVALDADSSGQAAMSRAAQEAERAEVELQVVELPAGRDPADLLEQEGPEALAARFERTIPALEFEVRRVVSTQQLGTPAGVDRALDLRTSADCGCAGTEQDARSSRQIRVRPPGRSRAVRDGPADSANRTNPALPRGPGRARWRPSTSAPSCRSAWSRRPSAGPISNASRTLT